MRFKIAAFVVVLTALMAAPAVAAPTCQDRVGDTVRCGTPTAMPVGWTAPAWDRQSIPSDKSEELKAVVFLLLLFALIALLPDFEQEQWDGSNSGKAPRDDPKDDRRI